MDAVDEDQHGSGSGHGAGIEVVVNGAPTRCAAGSSVADLVAQLGGCAPDGRGIAVAIGEEIVPAGRWATTPLAPGDRLELLGAVAGG